MKHPNQIFWGVKTRRLDLKRRVSIPPPWRPTDWSTVFLRPAVAHELPLLSVLNQTAYDNEVARVIASDMPSKEMRVLLGKLVMLCRETTVNDQGRLLIPKDLCEQVGLGAGSKVVLVGCCDHFEIWNEENFEIACNIACRDLPDDIIGVF